MTNEHTIIIIVVILPFKKKSPYQFSQYKNLNYAVENNCSLNSQEYQTLIKLKILLYLRKYTVIIILNETRDTHMVLCVFFNLAYYTYPFTNIMARSAIKIKELE